MAWFWMALGAAVLWGLGYSINQLTLKHFSSFELLFFESLIVCLIMTVYFAIRGELPSFIGKLSDPRQLGLIAASSIIYIVASVLIFNSISESNAGLAAIIESCYPIFTVLFAFIIFGEFQLNLLSAIGFTLILCGIIVVKVFGK